MTKFLLASALIAGSINAFAATPVPGPQPVPPPMPGPIQQTQIDQADFAKSCPSLGLTKVQRDSIFQLKTQEQTALKAQRDQIKQNKKSFRQGLADKNVTQADVAKREQALRQSVQGLIDLMFANTNQIVFNILTPDQRADGLACMERIHSDVRKNWKVKMCAGATPLDDENNDNDNMN